MKNPGAGPGFEVAIPAQRGLSFSSAKGVGNRVANTPSRHCRSDAVPVSSDSLHRHPCNNAEFHGIRDSGGSYIARA